MRDVQVDIETSGTKPDRHGIIQIAAVRFDVASGEVGQTFFNESLLIPNWRSWEESTREWWGKQKREILQDILSRARPAGEVMDEFATWVGYGNESRFWSKPLSFDFPFVASYFADYGIHNPFDFRLAMDCRSYLHGLAYPDKFVSEKDLPFEGHEHNALFDVLHQIKWVLHNQQEFGNVPVA